MRAVASQGTTVKVIVVMGVSGSGKSTLAAELVRRTGWAFAEADDFHSAANVAKMAAGRPLTDADRRPGWRPSRAGSASRNGLVRAG
jgi:gluconokinase